MKKFLKKIMFLSVFLTILISSNPSLGEDTYINIIFTHDLHDNIEPYNTIIDGELVNIGGFERINQFIEREKADFPQSLVLDAGDYSMGSLFQTIQSIDSPSLRLMGIMGYDALAIGNHEFDYGPKAYGKSLDIARIKGGPLAKIVATNLDYDQIDQDLKKSLEEYGVSKHLIIEKNNLKIGIIGLLGKDAQYSILSEGLNFINPIEAARNEIDKIKDKVDMIICLSHSGTWSNPLRSEDERLAKKCPEIDLIISGHTHRILGEPIVYKDTYIVSTGMYGENIGKILLKKEGDRFLLEDYQISPLDQHIERPKLSPYIEEFKKSINENYLAYFDMTYDEIVAFSDFNFTASSSLARELKEEPLANLISDSYIYKIKSIEADDYEEVSLSVVTAGSIKSSFTKGEITLSDVFNVSSLGIGPDGLSVSPLISIYLNGREIKLLGQMDSSFTKYMRVSQLFFSGLEYEYNPRRLFLNKVTKINLVDENNNKEELEDDRIYRVVASLNSGQMLELLGEITRGFIKIIPKDKNSIPIKNLEDGIVYEDGREVKEWKALADYLKSFEKVDGLARIPDRYRQAEGRKSLDNSKNLLSIVSNPNKYALIIYSLGLLLIVILLCLLRLVFRLVKRIFIKR